MRTSRWVRPPAFWQTVDSLGSLSEGMANGKFPGAYAGTGSGTFDGNSMSFMVIALAGAWASLSLLK